MSSELQQKNGGIQVVEGSVAAPSLELSQARLDGVEELGLVENVGIWGLN